MTRGPWHSNGHIACVEIRSRASCGYDRRDLCSRLQRGRISKGANVLQASAGETQRDRNTSRGALERIGFLAFRTAGPERSVLHAATVGTGAAVPSRADLRVPHRGFVLSVLTAVGVLAAIALPSHASRVTRAEALPTRHRVLTGLAAGGHRSRAPAGLLNLSAAEQAPVSAALGRDLAAYRIRGSVAHNAAQQISARFTRSGVSVTSRSARLEMSLEAFGRTSALQALAPASPVASADRVSYARGPVREWWANGPLGLEQGFDIAQRPAGSGALTLSLAVSGSVRRDKRAVLLPGGLRYAGLRATDARGRSLRAWLQVRDGRILVRVADRGARYPLRIDPTVEQAELTPSDGVGCDGDCGDEFGYSVATSGNTVVVGAPYHAANSQANSGAVYVFQMPAAGWASATQTAELTDSALGGKVELGYSVAISSDGDTIAAGAPAGSQGFRDPNGVGTQGTVDVFTTTGAWTSTSTPKARLTVAGAPATESPSVASSAGRWRSPAARSLPVRPTTVRRIPTPAWRTCSTSLEAVGRARKPRPPC